MSQIPDIQPDLNRDPENKKKKKDQKGAGFLARLFGGGGGGAGGLGGLGGAGGLGGLGGGLSGLGGAAATGGLLATKAGLLAIILAASTVAAGIGLVGYRLFGSNSVDETAEAGNLQLFASKPKDNPNPAANAVPKDGSSPSLSMVAQANSMTPKAPELPPAPEAKDATAAAPAQASVSSAESSPINAVGSGGSGVNKNLLKGGGKFGELTKGFGGGGALSGGAGGAAGAKTGDGAGLGANGAKTGKSTAMAHNTASALGASRAFGSRRGSNVATRQLMAVQKDQRGAMTSYSAGRTYDGNTAQSGGNIGPEGGAIGAGMGDGAGNQPKSMPNSAAQTNKQEPPPTPPSHDVTPWAQAIKTAQMLLMLGAMILMIMDQIKGPQAKMIKSVLAAIVMAMGAAVVALGAQVSGGQYGQKAQGGVLAAAGIGLTAAAVWALMDVNKGGKPSETGAAGEQAASQGAQQGAQQGADKGAGGLLGNINPYVLLGGGAALIGMIGTSMLPPKRYPSKDFQNGTPPDDHWFGYREAPSQTALKRYLA